MYLVLLLQQTLFTILIEIFHDLGLQASYVHSLIIHPLHDNQFRTGQIIMFQIIFSSSNLCSRNFITNQHNTNFLILIRNLTVNNLCIGKIQFFADEIIGRCRIDGILHNTICQIYCRTHGSQSNDNNVLLNQFLTLFVHKLFPLEVHHAHSNESCQTNKYRINEI